MTPPISNWRYRRIEHCFYAKNRNGHHKLSVYTHKAAPFFCFFYYRRGVLIRGELLYLTDLFHLHVVCTITKPVLLFWSLFFFFFYFLQYRSSCSLIICLIYFHITSWGSHGRDRMVVGFTTNAISAYHHSSLKLWVWILLMRGVLYITLCDKVCLWLVAGRWFSPPIKLTAINQTNQPSWTGKIITSWNPPLSCTARKSWKAPTGTWCQFAVRRTCTLFLVINLLRSWMNAFSFFLYIWK